MDTYQRFSGSVRQEDGYYKPCYRKCSATQGLCESNDVCYANAEPHYKVYNMNAKYLVVPPYEDKVDGYAYYVPVSVFDSMVVQEEAHIVDKHYFYDTHDELLIKKNLEVYDEQNVGGEGDKCIRIEPCSGVLKDNGWCCSSLLPLAQRKDTGLVSDMTEAMKNFLDSMNGVSIMTPRIQHGVKTQDLSIPVSDLGKVQDIRLILEELPSIIMSGIEPVRSSLWLKYLVLMIGIFSVLILAGVGVYMFKRMTSTV